MFFFKQKTAYVMRISDWSSDVCSSDLAVASAVKGFVRRSGTAHDVTHLRADIQLAWTADFVVGIGQHFVPLGDPAHGTGQCKNGGAQSGWTANGALHVA